MTQTITLHLPDEIAAHARQLAADNAQEVEQVLISHLQSLSPLALLPDDQRHELEALRYLSDDALWTIAREQLPPDAQAQLSQLLAQGGVRTLSEGEQQTLDGLLERADQVMLRKAGAASLLQARGYPFRQEDFRRVD